MNFRAFALCLAFLVGTSTQNSVRADLIQTLSLTPSGGFVATLPGESVSSFTGIYSGLVADGVMFDALLTARGFRLSGGSAVAANLTQTASGGLGVSGGSSNLLNDEEAILFEVSILSATGGTVNFNGFQGLSLREYQSANDSAVVSTGFPVTGANTLATLNPAGAGTVAATFALAPNNIFVSGGLTTSSLRLGSITGSFTGTTPSVPEPSSLSLVALSGLLVLRRRRQL